MAIDSLQKRMSAMNPSCPWRGPLVAAGDTAFTQGNRQAADFMYSGILATLAAKWATEDALSPISYTEETSLSSSWAKENAVSTSWTEEIPEC